MDRQCEDRAHRIGQVRDVHVYRLVTAHTVEEALLRRADEKRILGKVVLAGVGDGIGGVKGGAGGGE